MQFLPGQVRLSDIVNGTLGAGSVPLDRLVAGTLAGGIITLDKLGAGVLSVGTVPLTSLGAGSFPISRVNHVVFQANDGVGVVIGAAFTEVVELDLGTLFTGDVLMVGGGMETATVAVAQRVYTAINRKSGTATLQWQNDNDAIQKMDYATLPGFPFSQNVAGVVLCTSGGTCVLKLESARSTQNFTTAVNKSGLQVLVFRED